MDTIVIRIWTPAAQAGGTPPAGGTHGTAQHVGSGRTGIFRDSQQLVRLIEELRRCGGAEGTSTTQQTERQENYQ